MKLKTFLQLFGGLAIVLTLFRFIALDYWWVRMFDFPHVQLTILTAIAFLVYFIRFDIKYVKDYIFVIIILGCLVLQATRIIPYTFLASTEIKDTNLKDDDKTISLYTANVFQKNKKREKLLTEINNLNPDMVLLMETHEEWFNQVDPELSDKYSYSVTHPLSNTYGMLLYSKLPLINPTVQYMVDDSIPSIHTKVALKSSDTVQFYAIHPTPPMPTHNPKSTDRDAEMMITAELSRQRTLPTIVAGDFNDVAWSQTTRLFQRVSGLLDPRKGRGFFNTYSADNFLLRWPLDHLFVSEEFRVKHVSRGGDIDSDHFPMYAELVLIPEKAAEQKLPPPSEDDLEAAESQREGYTLSELVDD
ncbi:endonuclease/exonuclease/phosphatase family protein [Flavobacteriaceae bacterium TK19130]|nr:endonuclease/exonuclease/phosphatase family protein [Thermobacterium salinum]